MNTQSNNTTTSTSIAAHVFAETSVTIRTVVIGDDIMFIAKDVAEALGYKDTGDAIRRHCDDMQVITRKSLINNKSGETRCFDIPDRGLQVIPESDVYSLIFGSKLPSAKAFKRWVTKEVLPSIRKAGGYISGLSVSDGVSMEAQRILIDHLKAQAIPALRELDTLNRYGNIKPEQLDRVINEVSKRTALPSDIIKRLNAAGVSGLLTTNE
ncbi:TPA: hypothetical protein NUX20_004106 [Escherichia coli]|nr:hypothetical protein [Escherichia coli]